MELREAIERELQDAEFTIHYDGQHTVIYLPPVVDAVLRVLTHQESAWQRRYMEMVDRLSDLLLDLHAEGGTGNGKPDHQRNVYADI